MNTSFLIVAYLVSQAVDWIFQDQWQATNKSNWTKGNRRTALGAVLTHSGTYACGVTVILDILRQIPEHQVWIVAIVLFVSHAIIDTRIPVKWIMRAKGLTPDQINDYPNYGFMHIGIDHRLHEIVLVILAMLIKLPR